MEPFVGGHSGFANLRYRQHDRRFSRENPYTKRELSRHRSDHRRNSKFKTHRFDNASPGEYSGTGTNLYRVEEVSRRTRGSMYLVSHTSQSGRAAGRESPSGCDSNPAP